MWLSRSRTALLCLFSLLFTVSSCSTLRRWTRPERKVQPLTLGAVLPLSGPYALVGKATQEGLALALRGSSVKLLVRDSKGEAQTALTQLEELALQQGVMAIVGGIADEESQALADRADELGVPLLTLSKVENITQAGNYVFRLAPTLKQQTAALAQYSSCQLGQRSFAILAPDTDYGRTLSQGFTEAIEERGGTIGAQLTYAADQTTFTKEARQLSGRQDLAQRADYQEGRRRIERQESDPFRRRKALERLAQSIPPRLSFQALFLPDGWKSVSLIAPALAVENMIVQSCDAREVERVRKTVGQEQLAFISLLGWSGWNAPKDSSGLSQLISRGGKHLNCAVYVDAFFADSERKATQAFVSRFQPNAESPSPSLVNALGYDAGALLKQLLEKDSPSDSHVLQGLLANVKGFEGATGRLTFNWERETERPFFFVQVRAEGLRELNVDPDAACRSPLSQKPWSAAATGLASHHGF